MIPVDVDTEDEPGRIALGMKLGRIDIFAQAKHLHRTGIIGGQQGAAGGHGITGFLVARQDTRPAIDTTEVETTRWRVFGRTLKPIEDNQRNISRGRFIGSPVEFFDPLALGLSFEAEIRGGDRWEKVAANYLNSKDNFRVRELKDGRVFLAYGYRKEPYGIRARVLDPDCANIRETEEFIIRDDGGSPDLGYPWCVTLPDGRILVVYYLNKKEDPHFADLSLAEAANTGTTAFGGIRFIAATTLEP